MVTPRRIQQVTKDDIDYARRWLRLHEPDAPRRSWIDVEHAIDEYYPGGLAAFLDRGTPA